MCVCVCVYVCIHDAACDGKRKNFTYICVYIHVLQEKLPLYVCVYEYTYKVLQEKLPLYVCICIQVGASEFKRKNCLYIYMCVCVGVCVCVYRSRLELVRGKIALIYVYIHTGYCF
jgi:hypothetical protein